MSTQPKYMEMDPLSDLDYGVDWATWLDPGDTLATATWSVPADLNGYSEDRTATEATIRLKAADGVTLKVGTRYSLISRITTTQGATEEQLVVVLIKPN